MAKIVKLPASADRLKKKGGNTELSGNKITAAEAVNVKNATEYVSDIIKNGGKELTARDYLDKMLDASSSFSFDVNTDPLYKEYRDMYEKEGNLAAKNVFGLATALTGGYGNSFASTAAGAAVNDYLDKITDTALSLRDAAYTKHRDRVNDLYTAYKAYSDIEDKEYSKLQDEEKLERDGLEQAYSLALKLASAGDYSFLEKLGVDTSTLKREEAEKRADFLASHKDYSALKELGVDISALENEELRDVAKLFASYGDYSLLESLGINTENQEREDYLNRLLLQARYYKQLR